MSAITDADRRQIHRLRHNDGMTESSIAKIVGRARSTVHEVLQQEAPSSNGNGVHDGDPDAIEGQQKIDGSEVPAPQEPEVIEEVRVDGLRQLGMIDFGGKHPQSAVVTLSGGQFELQDGTAYLKGDRIFFAGQAQVFDVGSKDKLDTKTMIPTTAVQRHTARIFELHTGDLEQTVVGLFKQYVQTNRQAAVKLADALTREANGGG